MMTCGRNIIVLTSFLLCVEANAMVTRSSENPYLEIARRNLFDLKPVIIAHEPPPAPVPRVILTGTATLFPGKRALLKVEVPSKLSEPAREESYVLAEGQQSGQVEVLKIDEETGSVQANIYGTVMELTFEKNGPKLSASIHPKP
jgi:hypothetical protein